MLGQHYKLWAVVNFLALTHRAYHYKTYIRHDGYFFNNMAPRWLMGLEFYECWVILFLAGLSCFFPGKRVALLYLCAFNHLWVQKTWPAISGADIVLRVMSPLVFLSTFKFLEKHIWFLMKAQVSVIYLSVLYYRWGDPHWAQGTFMQYFLDSMFMRIPFQVPPWMSVVLTYGTLGIELSLAIGLWFSRTRFYAFGAGVLLFGGMFILTRINLFPIVMIGFCHTLFFTEDDWRMIGLRREKDYGKGTFHK